MILRASDMNLEDTDPEAPIPKGQVLHSQTRKHLAAGSGSECVCRAETQAHMLVTDCISSHPSASFVCDPVHAFRCPVFGEIRGHLQKRGRDSHTQVHAVGDTRSEESTAKSRVVPRW